MEKRKVRKVGDSLTVSIPAVYARDLGIKDGDDVEINLITRYDRRGIQVLKSRG